MLRVALQRFEQAGKCAFAVLLWQQADVFGKHREQAAGEKAGDEFGRMADAFERFGDFGQVLGDFARDFGRSTRWVERQRVEPQGFEAFADGFVGEIGKLDPMRA